MHTRTFLLTLLLCCAAAYGAQAQGDDLYFSPKKQKEIDQQNAKLRAYYDSLQAAQRALTSDESGNDYEEKWMNFDSTDSRGYRGIYDLSQKHDSYKAEEERESYADRLRYEDPTYVVYVRDPYWYDPWWGWGRYYSYPYHGWGISYNSHWGWGWNVGWNYYGYGWGHPYYGWVNPYYDPYYSWSWGHYHRPPTAYYHKEQGPHRGGISGTDGGTGYTNGRSSSISNYTKRMLNMPAIGRGSSSQQSSSGRTSSGSRVTSSGRSSSSSTNNNSYSAPASSERQTYSAPSSNSSPSSNSNYNSNSSYSSRTSSSGSGFSSSSNSSSSGRSSGSSSGGGSYGSSGARRGSGR